MFLWRTHGDKREPTNSSALPLVSTSGFEKVAPLNVVPLSDTPTRSEATKPVDRLSALVLDEDHPVANALVDVLPAEFIDPSTVSAGSPSEWRSRLEPAASPTRDDGTCELTKVKAGSLVIARKEGFCATGVSVGDDDRVVIPLVRGATIRGTIYNGHGVTVAGATVHTAYPNRHPWLTRPTSPEAITGALFPVSATSNADGTYALEHVSDTIHLLVASKEGHASNSLPWALEYSPPNMDFFLYPGSARVIGTVIDGATDRPIAGAQVCGAVKVGDVDHYDTCIVVTDSDGTFENPGLVGGIQRQALCVTRSGYGAEIVSLEPIAIGDTNSITVKLLPAATQRGRVETAEGKPVADASVNALEPASRLRCEWVFADSLGEFRLESQRPGREFRLLVKASGYVPLDCGPFEFDPDEEVVVRLERAGAIRGRLLSPGKLPVAGSVHLVASDVDGSLTVDRTATCSAPACEFAFESLNDDRYHLIAVGDGFAPTVIQPIVIDSLHREHELSVELTPGCFVDLHITAADTRKPVPDARLALYDASVEYSKAALLGIETQTDEAGNAKVGPLPLSTPLGVRVFAGDYVPQWIRLNDPCERRSAMEIELVPGGVVGIRILDRSGQSVPGMEGWVIPLAQWEVSSLFPENTITFRGLVPGRVSANARITSHSDPTLHGLALSRDITVEAGKPQLVEFRLGEGSKVHGRCVLPTAGDQSQHFRVTLIPDDNSLTTVAVPTALDGSFAVAGVAAGDWRAMVETLDLPYALYARKAFHVSEGEDKELEVRFGECVIAGTVLGPSGQPVPNSRFECAIDKGAALDDSNVFGWQTCNVDAAGHYEMRGLARGTYSFDVRAPGCAPQWGQLDINGAQSTVTHDFSLRPSAKVLVHLVDEAGGSCASAQITCEPVVASLPGIMELVDVAGRFIGTDDDDNLRFDQVTDGDYVIMARLATGATASGTVHAVTGEVVRCELKFPAAK